MQGFPRRDFPPVIATYFGDPSTDVTRPGGKTVPVSHLNKPNQIVRLAQEVPLCKYGHMFKNHHKKEVRGASPRATAYQRAAPVEKIQSWMDALHLTLDAFVSGRTKELRGQSTRDRINDALTDIDSELKRMQQLINIESSSDQVVVGGLARTEFAEIARQLDQYLNIIIRALYPYTSGIEAKPMSKSARNTMNLVWPEIRRSVSRLNEILGNVEA